MEDQTLFSELRERAGISLEEAADQMGYTLRTVYRWENGEAAPRNAVVATLRQLVEKTHPQASTDAKFTFIDLFAGIGGLRKGFERVGGRCVFTCEYDESCRKTYLANYPCSHRIAGDIREVKTEDVSRHDVLLAGFPCQPFSIAGVSKKNALGRPHGFACEAQGTLFFDVARLIAHHRPKAFLLENVKNLMSHDKGNTFRVIRQTLTEELGYHVQFRVIDAKAFVPQHRERIFIVGFRDKSAFRFEDLELPPSAKWPKLGDILHSENGSEAEEPPYTLGRMAAVAPKYTLTEHLWNYLQRYAEKHRAKGNGFGFSLVEPKDVTRTLSARYYKDGSEILVSRGKGNSPRRLTPRECARLMGFDSPGERPFRIVVADTPAYKQFGNAVVVPVIEAIAKLMLPHLIAAKTTAKRGLAKIRPAQPTLFDQ
nr:DNA (cytosine-5-)-methyltransferase [Zavarzinella formosa]